MKRRYKVGLGVLAGLLIGVGFGVWAQTVDFPVLSPKGEIADKQLDLLVFASLLSLLVVIPVFILLGVVAYRYRDGRKATYKPNWHGNVYAEAIWWGIPFVLIGILSVVIWNSSHALDPYRPIESNKEPVNVQVVALQWRWLFIYPDEKIASINQVAFPAGTPVNFTITADAPMNSFWIPSLGGQVYAMNGMSTKLHLVANEEGDFNGVSANISGKGYAKMKFVATAKSEIGYEKWVKEARSQPQLDWSVYETLAKPSEDASRKTYRLTDPSLYDKIVNKYMPEHTDKQSHGKGHGE